MAYRDIPVRQPMNQDPDLARAIEALRARLGGTLLQAGDEGYDAARELWNSMFDPEPALIARCTDEQDVMAAVDFARTTGMLTAVRGGGHNAAGMGSCDGGFVIDLSPMQAVQVDASQRCTLVQGGATWASVDRETQRHGLAVPGGMISSTGVGGLTLGGGIGWLRGRHGLTIDNLLSVQVVTADGQLRTASAEQNADLFWAVRGGGGNFGVITSFEFRLHPVGPEVMFLATLYHAEEAPRVMRGWRDFLATAPDDIQGTMVEFSTLPESSEFPPEAWGKPVIAVAGLWAGEAAEGERRVQPLRELADPLIDLSGRLPYCEAQQLFDEVIPWGAHRAYFKSLFLDTLDDDLIDTIAAYGTRRPTESTLFSVWRMGGAVQRVAPDATAFGDRSMEWMLSIDTVWDRAEDDERCINWARGFWEDIAGRSAARIYLNFSGLNEEGEHQLRTGLGEDNFRRLAALKAVYDPDNLFRVNCNIPPAPETPPPSAGRRLRER